MAMCDTVQAIAIYSGSHILERFHSPKYPIRPNKIITREYDQKLFRV